MEGGGGWVWWEGNRRREGKGGCDGKGVGGGRGRVGVVGRE